MSVHTSTVTTKGQTTVPESIRTALGLQVGKMLVWEITPGENGKPLLTVQPSPELDDLAGCLKAQGPFVSIAEEKRAGHEALTRSAANRNERSQRRK